MSRIKCDAEGNYIEAYGYKLNEIVTAKYDLFDEQGGKVQAGDKLRIVAITPKVVMFSPAKRATLNAQDGFEKRDSKELFLNLVRADQEKDYGRRIREDFCCITKKSHLLFIHSEAKQ